VNKAVASPSKRRPTSARTSLARQVYDALERAIIVGELKPGTRLSAEAIATAFAVSRSPAREAMVDLERVGLIEQMSNRDRRVTVPTEGFITDVYDVWSLLESERLCEASLVADAAAHTRIDYLLERLEAANDFDDAAALLSEFHHALQEGCRNRQLHRVADDWYRYVSWFRHLYVDYLARHSDRALGEHRQIVDCFKRRDTAALTAITRGHIRHHRDLVLAAWRLSDIGAGSAGQSLDPVSHP
jgi:DNA-binding GntR family transcriptional regulator